MVKRAPARRRPGKAKPGTKGLGPAECRLDQPTGTAAEVAEAIEKAGGCVVGSYKEPLAGYPVVLSILPIDAVEPTPFQRDLPDAHHKRLADVINKTGRFLDPIIAVVAPKGRLLDSQRSASPRSHAPPWSEINHCARRG
jgi:ParB family transcriptional regulator, chromosome partitioning protein